MFTLQYRFILDGERGFFQAGPDGREDTFSLSYAVDNLSSATRFLFSIGQDHPNSYLLSVFGLSSILLFCYYCIRKANRLTGMSARGTVAYFFLLAIAFYALVITFFNFGLFEVYITNRLSFPLYLAFILFTPFVIRRMEKAFVLTALIFGLFCGAISIMVLPEENIITYGAQFSLMVLAYGGVMALAWQKPTWRKTIIPGFLIFTILTATIPISRAQRYSKAYESNDVVMAQIEFLEKVDPEEKILWAAAAPYPGLLTMTNCISVQKLNSRAMVAKRSLTDKVYTNIYIGRTFNLNNEGEWQRFHKDLELLNEDIFELEMIREKIIEPGILVRFERVVAIHLPSEPVEELAIPLTPGDL